MKNLHDMHLIFHGVRGSRPVYAPDILLHGGNSTCIELDSGHDFHIFIDGGTGLLAAARKTPPHRRRKKFYFLITHTHWDHVLGLPFFPPLSDPECEFHFYAPRVADKSFAELFQALHAPGHLSVQATVRAKTFFHEIGPGADFVIDGKVRVSTLQVNHQHITLGYRVSTGECSTVIITDIAPLVRENYLGAGMREAVEKQGFEAFSKQYEQKLHAFLSGVHTVVYDTHFTQETLKPDWGHSTPELALDACRAAKVERLIMFHHAPENTDRQVIAKLTAIRKAAVDAGVEVVTAKEEDEWLLRSA